MIKNIVSGYTIRIDQIFTNNSSMADSQNIEIRKEKTLLAKCRTKEEIIKAVEEYFKEE